MTGERDSRWSTVMCGMARSSIRVPVSYTRAYRGATAVHFDGGTDGSRDDQRLLPGSHFLTHQER
jgi:hypothetical protein